MTEAERFLSQLRRERREPSISIPTPVAPVPGEGLESDADWHWEHPRSANLTAAFTAG